MTRLAIPCLFIAGLLAMAHMLSGCENREDHVRMLADEAEYSLKNNTVHVQTADGNCFLFIDPRSDRQSVVLIPCKQ